MSNGSERMPEDGEVPTVVADDVRYIDSEGNDVTDETIERNLKAAGFGD